MTEYENITRKIQKAILVNTIHLIPELKGKILRRCVDELLKLIRLERARAKNELVDKLNIQAEDYSITKDGKKFIDIEDLKYLSDNLKRETYLLRKEEK